MLTTNQSYATYLGNGATTLFPFGFIVSLASNLVVSITNNNVNPPTTTILSPSQYTVTGIGLETGGNITYPISGSPLPTGWSLTIQRIVPYQQNTSLTNQGAFYPQVVEACLDNLTMQTQQLAAQIAGVPIPALQVAETQPENDNSNAVATDAFVQNQFISGGMGWASLMYPGYGADPTGVHDSTAALNAAIASGYDVFVPPGKYLISGQIVMPTSRPVKIRGISGNPSVYGTIPPAYGSIFLITSTTQSPFIYASGDRFEGLTFYYPNQLPSFSNNSGVPIVYPYTFSPAPGQSMNDCGWDTCQFPNAYNGIDARVTHGTFEFKNLCMFALENGINVDGGVDCDWFENVRFHPRYWDLSASLALTYAAANATGITLGRSDGFRMAHIFANGLNVGFKTISSVLSSGTIPWGSIVDMEWDDCNYGWNAQAGQIIASNLRGNTLVSDFYVPSGLSANLGFYQLNNVFFSPGSQTYNVDINSQITLLIEGGSITNTTGTGGSGAIHLNLTNIVAIINGVYLLGGNTAPIVAGGSVNLAQLILSGNSFNEAPSITNAPTQYRYMGNTYWPDAQAGLSPTPVVKAVGTVTLSSGTKTATIPAGCTYAFGTDTTAANPVQCAISGTTLTVTGTGNDVINYQCF